MEAVIIIDVLRRAKAEVVVASVGEKLEIVASRNVKLVADVLLDDVINNSFDLIVLPVRDGPLLWYLLIYNGMFYLVLNILCIKGGLGGAQAFTESEKLVNLLKKQRESNKLYGAICASPALVLEPHGLLKVCFMHYFQFENIGFKTLKWLTFWRQHKFYANCILLLLWYCVYNRTRMEGN